MGHQLSQTASRVSSQGSEFCFKQAMSEVTGAAAKSHSFHTNFVAPAIIRSHSLLASVQHRNEKFSLRSKIMRVSGLEEFQEGTSFGVCKHRELQELITSYSQIHEVNCLRLRSALWNSV